MWGVMHSVSTKQSKLIKIQKNSKTHLIDIFVVMGNTVITMTILVGIMPYAIY